jgi:hypothetical protein
MKRLIWLALFLVAVSASAQTVKVAVIPIDYTGNDWSGTGTEQSIRDAMAEATGIFLNASRGTVTFTTLVGKPFRVTKVPGQCFEGYTAKAIQGSGLVADKYLFLTQDQGCRYGGEASLNGVYGFVNAGTASYVIAHELGHMFGLNHANSMVCIFPGNLLQCTFHEYGDPIDVMAGGSTVQAYERRILGYPISSVRHPGGTATYAMSSIEAGGSSLSLSRADGIGYEVELRMQGFYVRMNYDARMNYCATLRPGAPGINYGPIYRDVTGGVQLTAVDSTHLLVERFDPPIPTPGPEPTAAPIRPTSGPPVTPNECWVAKPYIRCSPTPLPLAITRPGPPPVTRVATATPVPPTEVPTAAPPPSSTPTLLPCLGAVLLDGPAGPYWACPTATPSPAPASPVAPSTTPQTPPKPSSGGGSSALLLWGGLVAFLGTLAAILFNRKKKGTTP